MPVQVNTKVGVGAIASVDNVTSIGTDGLTFCIGVIAVGAIDGAARRTCAHFSCGFGGAPTPEKTQQIKDKTTAILTANFANDSIWGLVNHTPNEWTSNAIIAACKAYFTSIPNPDSRDKETIYINDEGVITASFDNVVGVLTIGNDNAEVNP